VARSIADITGKSITSDLTSLASVAIFLVTVVFTQEAVSQSECECGAALQNHAERSGACISLLPIHRGAPGNTFRRLDFDLNLNADQGQAAASVGIVGTSSVRSLLLGISKNSGKTRHDDEDSEVLGCDG
jgi:hypothetical protein